LRPETVALSVADPAAAREEAERAIALTASVICDAYLHGCDVGLVVWGVLCPAFALRHTLPHRQRILEALATLDVDEPGRAGPETTIPHPRRIEPTAVVRPGVSVAGGRVVNGRITLGTAEMAAYVKELDEDVEQWLRRTGKARQRRGQDTNRRLEAVAP